MPRSKRTLLRHLRPDVRLGKPGQQRTYVRAVQLLLGHSKLDNTVRYLGIEVDDAVDLAEAIDV